MVWVCDLRASKEAHLHKPFTPIESQVALLRSRGLRTDSRTSWILEREGYYSVVNGYKNVFIDSVRTLECGDDRYLPGVAFNDLYELFLFDRRLRFQCFQVMTLAEACLKTVSSYEFSKQFPNIVNPYLSSSSYSPESGNSQSVRKLISIFEKILELDGNPRNRGIYGDKAYLKHCMEHHDGEVPMWVLANDLTLGQIYWFYQSQNSEVRRNIAVSFTGLYDDSHRRPLEVTSQILDKIYRRIKDYRNICAHDERLYCAHPHDRNINVFQLIQDLRYVIDKRRYVEFLQRVLSLIEAVRHKLPDYSSGIIAEMGLVGESELNEYLERIRNT